MKRREKERERNERKEKFFYLAEMENSRTNVARECYDPSVTAFAKDP